MNHESCKIYERYANTPSDIAQALYYYPQWAGHFLCNPDFCIERETYDSILILHTLRGSGILHYRGNDYSISKGQFALINCNEYHKYIPERGEAWEFNFLHFRGSNYADMYEHIYNLQNTCIFPYNAQIGTQLDECIQMTKNKSTDYEAAVSAKIHTMLYALILQPRDSERDKIVQVCDYIAKNHKQSLSTDTLAKIACLSRSYFSTTFKKTTGTTPHDYLTCYRLNIAKTLLLERDISMSEIAEQVGFCDTSTFIRIFKKKEGITPLQYRKEMTKSTVSD